MPTGALITNFENEAMDVIKATSPLFISGKVDETIRDHVLMAMMRRDGVISTGHSGTQVIWDVEYKQPTPVVYPDRGTITYSTHDLNQQLGANWAGYVVGTAIHLKTQMMNGGGLELVNLTTQNTEACINSLTDLISEDLYSDGSVAGQLAGFESFLTFNTPASTDILATPNDSYGGQDTDLGGEGSWSANLSTFPNATLARDYPSGQGTTTYAWNSPLGINWSASTWGTGGATDWESNCERALRQTFIWLKKNGGRAGRPNVAMMSDEMLRSYLDHQAAKQRIIIPHRESQDLGFEAVQQEGVGIHTDYACPVGTAYVMNTRNMELRALGSTLIGQYGPHDNNEDASITLAVFSFPQMCFRPRHIAKLYNFDQQ